MSFVRGDTAMKTTVFAVIAWSLLIGVATPANEASPQTDEVYRHNMSWGYWGFPVVLQWTPAEPPGTCPGYSSLTLGGSEDPWTTGARDDDTTFRGGRNTRSCGGSS